MLPKKLIYKRLLIRNKTAEIQWRQTRCELSDTLCSPSWRSFVIRHPFISHGGATVAGFIAGKYILGRPLASLGRSAKFASRLAVTAMLRNIVTGAESPSADLPAENADLAEFDSIGEEFPG